MRIRKLVAGLLSAVFLLAAGGCSGGGNGGSDADPSAVAKGILEQVEFRDALMEADETAVSNFYRLDDAIVGYSIHISGTGATAEEVGVLKVDKPENLQKALTAIDKRLEDLIFRFEDYAPAEMVKLKDPVIVSGGTVAILVLADDTVAAKAAAEEQLK